MVFKVRDKWDFLRPVRYAGTVCSSHAAVTCVLAGQRGRTVSPYCEDEVVVSSHPNECKPALSGGSVFAGRT
jgi:hypothetical protein